MAPTDVTTQEGYNTLTVPQVEAALADGDLTADQVRTLEAGRDGDDRKGVLAALAALDAPAEGDGDNGRDGDGSTGPSGTTTLDSHLDAPSTMAPGDAPADTVDPTERASSAPPDKGAAAQAGHGTVNAVVKVEGSPVAGSPTGQSRKETYTAYKPNGEAVTVTRNIETGHTTYRA